MYTLICNQEYYKLMADAHAFRELERAVTPELWAWRIVALIAVAAVIILAAELRGVLRHNRAIEGINRGLHKECDLSNAGHKAALATLAEREQTIRKLSTKLADYIKGRRM